MKHCRAYRTHCPECHKLFRHRKGVRFCGPRCQYRSWYKRHLDKARAIARACYHRHRRAYIRKSTARQRARRSDPQYQAHRREVFALWYARNWKRFNARQRMRYAKQKSKPVRPWGPHGPNQPLPDLIPKPKEEDNANRKGKARSQRQGQTR